MPLARVVSGQRFRAAAPAPGQPQRRETPVAGRHTTGAFAPYNLVAALCRLGIAPLWRAGLDRCHALADDAAMRVMFLGTGTSHGIPMIGCGSRERFGAGRVEIDVADVKLAYDQLQIEVNDGECRPVA
jgi:hypothetical protein